MFKKDLINITGKEIILKVLIETNCNQNYVDWLNNKAVNRFLETRHTENNLELVKNFVLEKYNSKHDYLFGIFLKHSNRHIGNIKLGAINFHYKTADISYFIGEKDCWGKGYATEAINLVVDFAFTELELFKVQAGVIEENLGSCKVLEKCGFTKEAVLKKQFIIDSRRKDQIIYTKFNLKEL